LAKIGEQYRQFGSADKIDWCEIVRKLNSIKNSYVKSIIRELRKNLNPKIFVCPFTGQLDIFEIRVQNKLLNSMPPGEFSAKLHFYEKTTPHYINITINFHQTLT
jgi:hypothetical protein